MLAAAAVLALALPAPATAATARLDGDTVVYEGGPESNSVRVRQVDQGPVWEFESPDVTQPWEGCAPAPREGLTHCPVTANARMTLGAGDDKLIADATGKAPVIQSLIVDAGDGADSVTIPDSAAVAPEIDGGPGLDDLRSHGIIRAGDGDDRITGRSNTLLDAGPGRDIVKVTGPAVLIRLGPGKDRLNINTFADGTVPVTKIYGGPNSDEFIAEFACYCSIFGEGDNDKFNLVNRMGMPPKFRAQRVDGGAGRDTGRFDGMDCLRKIEQVTLAKRLPNDKKWRCRSPV
jgi:hypothetical protein